MSEDSTAMVEGEDTSFVPKLDARQRAMLLEMGVRVWSAPPESGQVVEATEPASTLQARPPGVPPPSRTAVDAPAARAPQRFSAPDARPAAPAQRTASAQAGLQPRPEGIEQMDWPALGEAVTNCRACGLCQGRTQSVLGVGSHQAQWMVVGEAPGEQEDLQGEPFVGPSGQLLDNMLRAVGLSRQEEGAAGAYITNVVKCRPPANRNPQPTETAQCEPYLARQIALVKPKLILAMGRFAVQALLNSTEPLGRLRGRVHHYQDVPVIVTYHPAYLLRTPGEKAKAWADLCLAMDVAEQAAP